nr:uncharacterized protein LOC100184346 [Ciona intestinalis]|eukprot:XP_009861801.1 uncharacterized protein LOC100184346 [Ciona intestinalis]
MDAYYSEVTQMLYNAKQHFPGLPKVEAAQTVRKITTDMQQKYTAVTAIQQNEVKDITPQDLRIIDYIGGFIIRTYIGNKYVHPLLDYFRRNERTGMVEQRNWIDNSNGGLCSISDNLLKALVHAEKEFRLVNCCHSTQIKTEQIVINTMKQYALTSIVSNISFHSNYDNTQVFFSYGIDSFKICKNSSIQPYQTVEKHV